MPSLYGVVSFSVCQSPFLGEGLGSFLLSMLRCLRQHAHLQRDRQAERFATNSLEGTQSLPGTSTKTSARLAQRQMRSVLPIPATSWRMRERCHPWLPALPGAFDTSLFSLFLLKHTPTRGKRLQEGLLCKETLMRWARPSVLSRKFTK